MDDTIYPILRYYEFDCEESFVIKYQKITFKNVDNANDIIVINYLKKQGQEKLHEIAVKESYDSYRKFSLAY